MCPRSLLFLIPSMQQRKYLMLNLIHIKVILWLSSTNYAAFLLATKITQSNFGNALADSTRGFTKLSIWIQSPLIPHLSTLAKFLGIIARKSIATISSITGK